MYIVVFNFSEWMCVWKQRIDHSHNILTCNHGKFLFGIYSWSDQRMPSMAAGSHSLCYKEKL